MFPAQKKKQAKAQEKKKPISDRTASESKALFMWARPLPHVLTQKTLDFRARLMDNWRDTQI